MVLTLVVPIPKDSLELWALQILLDPHLLLAVGIVIIVRNQRGVGGGGIGARRDRRERAAAVLDLVERGRVLLKLHHDLRHLGTQNLHVVEDTLFERAEVCEISGPPHGCLHDGLRWGRNLGRRLALVLALAPALSLGHGGLDWAAGVKVGGHFLSRRRGKISGEGDGGVDVD